MRTRQPSPGGTDRPCLSLRAVAPLVLLGMLGACAGPSTGPSRASTNSDHGDVPLPEGAPMVTLLSAGREPRAPLRYRFTQGETRVGLMTTSMRMIMVVDGKRTPGVHLPKVVTTMRQTVTASPQPGTFGIEFLAEKIEVEASPDQPAQILETMRSQMQQVVGMKGRTVMSTRGHVLSTQLELPPGAQPELRSLMEAIRDSMSQIAVPLPAEAVGPGARWRALAKQKVRGVASDLQHAFELIDVQPSALSLAWTTTMNAPSQPLPEGTQGTLHFLKGAGSGKASLDLTSPIPRSETQLEIATLSTVMTGGRGVTFGMEMEMDVAYAPRAVGARAE